MKKTIKYKIDTTRSFDRLRSLTYVIATKRSGHHAFIEWMCGHLDHYLYLNNVNLNVDVEADKYQQIHLESDMELSFNHQEPSEFGQVEYNKNELKHLLLSYENRAANKVSQSGRFKSFQTVYDDPSISKQALIFLRDPINSLASIARYNEIKPSFKVSVEEQAEKWVQLAKAYFNPESVEKKLGMPVMAVSYNDFIREKLTCQSLNSAVETKRIERTDNLSRFGGGGDSKFTAQADNLSVDELERRWEMLENPRILIDTFDNNEQLRKLAAKFYRGFNPSEPMQRGIAIFLGTES